MVGSGFSRNAKGRLRGTSRIPSWSDLVTAMRGQLYPDHSREQKEHLRNSSPEQALSIAQEYEIAFGRSELHHCLARQVGDMELLPSDLHVKLLSFPWADVFTTNWDTLLERASDQVARHYDIVRNVDAIPHSTRPRIIKLHGSLPDHFPFLVTSEDYRRYPIDFAPFVNTVQQAMMETVLLLIGFSGTDPNFLHWSGWVRDHLGSSAPRIYLAGWLELSQHERRVLESRNVVPIDLARHPKAPEWSNNSMQHRLSAEWIVHSLWLGQPYAPVEWPNPPKRPPPSTPSHLQPVPEIPWTSPREDTSSTPSNVTDQDALERLEIWEHNRKLYPEWLALPTKNLLSISIPTRRWEEWILAVANSKNLQIEGRFKAIHELVWRREILMEPLGGELADVAKRVLIEVAKIVDVDGGLDDIENDDVARVALALVTHARLSFDRGEFDHSIELASPYTRNDSNAEHRITQERCLWSVYEMDFEALEELIGGWSTETGDPFWKIRKAALLFEFGDHAQAKSLVWEATISLRMELKSSRGIDASSRDAWISLLLHRLEETAEGGLAAFPMEPTPHIYGINYDALDELWAHQRAVQPDPETERPPPFDLGSSTAPTMTFFDHEYYITRPEALRLAAAHRSIRLGEVVGLPPEVNNFSITRQLMAPASELLFENGNEELALRTMLRIARFDEDDLLQKLLTRRNVAALSQDVVNSIAVTCRNIIEHTTKDPFASTQRGQISRVERLRVALETLSRLVLRLAADDAVRIFEQAIRLYLDRSVSTHPWLNRSMFHVLERSWQTMPQSHRASFTFDILASPIPGIDGLPEESIHSDDPGVLLDDRQFYPPERNAENEHKWSNAIQFLLRAVACGPRAREKAKLRLVHISLWKRFTEKEERAVADAVWRSEDESEPTPPTVEYVRDWTLFLLPQPKIGMAEKRLRGKWTAAANDTVLSDEALTDLLSEIGDAKENSLHFRYSLNFTDEDCVAISSLVNRWACLPVPEALPLFDQQRRQRVRQAVVGLATLLMHVEVAKPAAESLFKKFVHDLTGEDTPGFRLVPGLIKAIADKSVDILTEMRKGLASTSPNISRDSSLGLKFWLRMSKRGVVSSPPDDIIREIGIMVASQRPGALAESLATAAWIYNEGTPSQQNLIQELVLDGMGSLLHQLQYDTDESDDQFDIPLLRYFCAQLAKAMRARNCDHRTILEWEELARSDPLPEVRNVISTAQFGEEV